MTGNPLDEAIWAKSSYSAQEGNCVEVALTPEVIGVRDSKDRTQGHLAVSGDSWRAFVAQVKEGKLDF